MATLYYLSPTDLTSRMTEREILQLTSERLDVRDADVELVEDAFAWIEAGADPDDAAYTAMVKEVGGRILNALLWAEGRVNSFIRLQYEVPVLDSLGNPPAELKEASIALARHKLFTRRPGAVPPQVKEDYEETVAWLMLVGRRRAMLNVIENDVSQTSPSRSEIGTSDAAMEFGEILW